MSERRDKIPADRGTTPDHGLDVVGVADQLDVPLRTIERALARGIRRLRERLQR